jgi:hypothetical protein
MHSIGSSEIVLMSSMYLLQWTYVGWGVEGNALFHVSGLTLNSYDTLTYSTQKREQFFIIFLSPTETGLGYAKLKIDGVGNRAY